MGTSKPPLDVHVDVLIRDNCIVDRSDIQHRCNAELLDFEYVQPDVMMHTFQDAYLKEVVKSIVLNEMEPRDKFICMKDAQLKYHIYQLQSNTSATFDLSEDRQDVDGATYWSLPSAEFVGLWESLVFDAKIKSQLLKYVFSTLLFAEKGVDFSIIPWNKIVLLHGPPGTGKTSLCKALAQKISIFLDQKFTSATLLEINCHGLFSKWFSESGKLVAKMFHHIEEVIADPKSFVILLIDEVESLAHSRKASYAGNAEPSDSIRAVNSLLTQLDRIKRYPNVLILTTSNITEAIDIAIIDRADIKQFIGLPSADGIYQIYYTCICELQRVGIVFTKEKLLTLHELKQCQVGDDSHPSKQSLYLRQISVDSVGLSGRTIRKLPMLVHTNYALTEIIPIDSFLKSLKDMVSKQLQDNMEFSEMNKMSNKT